MTRRQRGRQGFCHCEKARPNTRCSCKRHINHEYMVDTPHSSEECIVFEYDKTHHKWKTSNYSSSQHNERVSVDEIESFLNEINETLAPWSKQYGEVYYGDGIYLCLTLTLCILLPIFFIYLCWLSSQQVYAKERLKEVKDKIDVIIQQKRSYFSEKRLTWQVPNQFPQWIELWLEEDDVKPSEKQEVVGYENFGYPQSSKVAPIGEMYNADMYSHV